MCRAAEACWRHVGGAGGPSAGFRLRRPPLAGPGKDETRKHSPHAKRVTCKGLGFISARGVMIDTSGGRGVNTETHSHTVVVRLLLLSAGLKPWKKKALPHT